MTPSMSSRQKSNPKHIPSMGKDRSPESTSSTEADRTVIAERPICLQLEIPSGYTQAIEARRRSATGEPGENYWQDDASYQLEEEIEPETHTLYVKGSITYNNNSPDS